MQDLLGHDHFLGTAAIGLRGQGNADGVADAFLQQALVYGLIAAAMLSASVAYAVSLPAFLCFILPCVLPPLAVLLLSNDPVAKNGFKGPPMQ